ncbi:hypothetical protein HAX54_030214, partial [Datura stramonium]|nr:hypothetical protein [Datura stramonium]
ALDKESKYHYVLACVPASVAIALSSKEGEEGGESSSKEGGGERSDENGSESHTKDSNVENIEIETSTASPFSQNSSSQGQDEKLAQRWSVLDMQDIYDKDITINDRGNMKRSPD